jgi:hypothetical protein
MIQRYEKHDPRFTAWIEGLNDAVEFLDDQLYKADEVASWKDLQAVITELSVTIAMAYEERLTPNDNLRRDTVSLSTTSIQEDSFTAEDLASRSAWTWQNFRSLGQLRASGLSEPDRLARDADTDTSCECSHGMDRYYTEVFITEVPAPKSSGPIIRQRRKEEQDTKFGTRRRGYPSFGSGR